jgi:hypothetical protein
VVHVKVQAKISDQEGRADPLRQQVSEVFNEAHLSHALEAPEVLADHAGEPIALPMRCSVTSARKRGSGKPPKRSLFHL